MVQPPNEQYPWPWLAMEPAKIVALTKYLMDAGEEYKLGSKFPLPSFFDPDHAVDCSGFTRWAIWHGTAAGIRVAGGIIDASPVTIPDGSVQQHEWCEAQGFKKSDAASCKLIDGATRIAFLPPGGGVGHVTLVVNGTTCESHGGKGVDMRMWGSKPWMAQCAVYVLSPPSEFRF